MAAVPVALHNGLLLAGKFGVARGTGATADESCVEHEVGACQIDIGVTRISTALTTFCNSERFRWFYPRGVVEITYPARGVGEGCICATAKYIYTSEMVDDFRRVCHESVSIKYNGEEDDNDGE